jgi:hypothetical protein
MRSDWTNFGGSCITTSRSDASLVVASVNIVSLMVGSRSEFCELAQRARNSSG